MSNWLASVRVITGAMVAMVLAAAPALACKGAQTVLADNFQTADSSWGPMFGANLIISDGQAQLTVPPGKIGGALYGGILVDSGDYCIDMIAPSVADPNTVLGGIIFGLGDLEDYYAFVAVAGGQAGVLHQQSSRVTLTVPMNTAPSLQVGANATNTIRVTWTGAAVSTYINGQLFAQLQMPQGFFDSKIGLYVDNATTAPVTYTFKNLNVTNGP